MDDHDSTTFPAETIEQFWSKVDRSGGPDACWPWTGARASGGYGQMSLEPRRGSPKVGAHRFALIAVGHIIPSGALVCHHCDSPPCCNPAHLFVGTQFDNMRDMVAKGRQVNPVFRGEMNSSAKITENDARLIRALRRNGLPYKDIAARFGISRQQASAIVLRRKWAHVSDETEVRR